MNWWWWNERFDCCIEGIYEDKTQREDIQQYQETIEIIIIDEDITTLEAYSFTEMTNLKRVRTLSFSQTGITSLNISKNVTETSEYTFKQCKSFKKENN